MESVSAMEYGLCQKQPPITNSISFLRLGDDKAWRLYVIRTRLICSWALAQIQKVAIYGPNSTPVQLQNRIRTTLSNHSPAVVERETPYRKILIKRLKSLIQCIN